MNISAIPHNNTSFGSNMVVLKILTLDGGREIALTGKKMHGPLTAFVKRVNTSDSPRLIPEREFMKQNLSQFRQYPKIASTSMATEKRYLIFGERDIDGVRELCTDHYKDGEISRETANKILVNSYIKPFLKKYRFARFKGDKDGVPAGITLHANRIKDPVTKNKVYNFGIDITDESGKQVFAVLPSVLPEVAKLQPQMKPVQLELPLFLRNA